MTQAHFDRHTQFEQNTSDLATQPPLFNDSSVLFFESIDEVHAHASEQVEQT